MNFQSDYYAWLLPIFATFGVLLTQIKSIYTKLKFILYKETTINSSSYAHIFSSFLYGNEYKIYELNKMGIILTSQIHTHKAFPVRGYAIGKHRFWYDVSNKESSIKIYTFFWSSHTPIVSDIANFFYNKEKKQDHKGNRDYVQQYPNFSFDMQENGDGSHSLKSIDAPSNRSMVESEQKNEYIFETFIPNTIPNKYRIDTPQTNRYEERQRNREEEYKLEIVSKDMENVADEIERFMSYKDKLLARKINIKRSILLYGSAGNGKSKFATYLNHRFNYPIIQVSLSQISTKQLFNLKEYGGFGVTIFLFEDIDCIFDGRENISKTAMDADRVSFDTFINFLDGVDSLQNAVVIMTTNHIERLDPALYRKGRVDYLLEVLPPTKEHKREILFQYFETEEEIDDVEKRCSIDGQSMAEFIDLVHKRFIEIIEDKSKQKKQD